MPPFQDAFSQVEHCARVIPHGLCRQCEEFGRKLRSILPNIPGHTGIRVEHYNTLQDITLGAEARCHLCVIILARSKTISPMGRSQAWVEISRALEDPLSFGNIDKTLVYTRVSNEIYSNTYYTLDIESYIEGKQLLERYGTFHNTSLNSGPVPQTAAQRAQLSRFTGSQEIYQMIQEWLGFCKSQHPACIKRKELRIPTRLLDVGFDHTNDVRVVLGNSIGDVEYATLSYCWGLVHQLMLLPENEGEFMKRISFDSLSRAGQDAVTVCRRLAVRYLWIDAICIMQGPDGDFQQEAPRMEDIYAGSVFTIVAASSKDSSQPFLQQRDPLGWLGCNIEGGYILGRDFCETSFGGYNVPDYFHINTRGWCFQERCLSPRSIYFGDKGIHWECRNNIACEVYPGIDDEHTPLAPHHYNSNPKGKYFSLLSLTNISDDLGTIWTALQLWGGFIKIYTNMELKYPTDRLVAIAGIASVLEKKFSMRAIFGLWEPFFAHELLWIQGSTVLHSKKNLALAPSWSWAGMSGKILPRETMNGAETRSAQKLIDSCSALVSVPNSMIGFATLGHFDAVTAPSNELVSVRGKLAACVLTGDRTAHDLYPTGTSRRFTFGFYSPDTAADETDLYCLLLRTEWRQRKRDFGGSLPPSQRYNWGLVLTPIQAPDERFRRVGRYREIVEEDQHPYFSNTFMWENAGDDREVLLA
ncbi:heterokaryon incompatibility protein-domain-containing protein [Xylaria telfairii]|nr:heterokaryon incompatibility protein-domain-containing protein [Xylaria telfairii]